MRKQEMFGEKLYLFNLKWNIKLIHLWLWTIALLTIIFTNHINKSDKTNKSHDNPIADDNMNHRNWMTK